MTECHQRRAVDRFEGGQGGVTGRAEVIEALTCDAGAHVKRQDQVERKLFEADQINLLRHASTVMLVPSASIPAGAINTTAITDANGEFSIQPLPRGRYRIYVRKTGFAREPDASTAQTIDVGAGQSVTDVELALQAGASIAGRILDANGRPAPLLTVSALRQPTGRDMTTVVTTAPMAQTNDRGEFRLDDLDAGNYLVIAAPYPRPFAPPRPRAMALAPTYYPGTRDSQTAEVITVAAGQAVDDLQFSLILLPAREVSGVVIDEAGLPRQDRRTKTARSELVASWRAATT